MNDNTSLPEDSILRRHYEQMHATSTAAATQSSVAAGEPEDSILRRHYRQLQSAAAPTPATKPALIDETTQPMEVPLEPPETAATPAPTPTPEPAKTAAPSPAKAASVPKTEPAAAPPSQPRPTPEPEPSGGFLSRLFRKLFGG